MMEQAQFCKSLPPPLPWEAAIFSSAIQQMVEANDSTHPAGTHLLRKATPLHVPVNPAFGAEQYIRRIHRCIPDGEPAAYVVAYVYIRRFLVRKEEEGEPFSVTSLSFQRLVLLSLMVAGKNLSQMDYSNAHYAVVGGMSTDEMNRLELLFLFALKFELHVDDEDFESCYAYLECIHREVMSRRRRQVDAVRVGTTLCEGGGQRANVTEEQLLARLETWSVLGACNL